MGMSYTYISWWGKNKFPFTPFLLKACHLFTQIAYNWIPSITINKYIYMQSYNQITNFKRTNSLRKSVIHSPFLSNVCVCCVVWQVRSCHLSHLMSQMPPPTPHLNQYAGSHGQYLKIYEMLKWIALFVIVSPLKASLNRHFYLFNYHTFIDHHSFNQFVC